MRVLLDTNIILDVLLNRTPWVTEAKAIWQAADENRLTGYVTATTLTNIFYVARRLKNLNTAQAAVQTCLDAFEICPVDRTAIEQAIAMSGNDFEDNLQIACAVIAGLDYIITRDPDDFRASTVSVLAPSDLLANL